MAQSPSWEANWFSASHIPCILWNPKVHYCICLIHVLSWARSIQSMSPHFAPWRSFLILSSHLHLGFPSGVCSSGFPTTILYAPLLSPLHATWPTHIVLLNLIAWIIIGEKYRSLSSSVCSLLHSHFTASLLGPNIVLSTLFSDTPSLHSPLIVSHQVSHPYKTTGKIIVPYILIFIFLNSKLEDKRFSTKW